MRKQNRQSTRITPQKKAFVSLGETFSGLCMLKDISINGVSISCISEIDPKSLGNEMTLYLPEDDIEVKSLPCKIVYQESEKIPTATPEDENYFKRYRCGIEFEELDEMQEKILSNFIKIIE